MANNQTTVAGASTASGARAPRSSAAIVLALAVWMAAARPAAAQDASQILRQAAEAYRALHSLEVEGTLRAQASYSGESYEVIWTVALAQADATMLPRESPVPALPQLIRRVRREVRRSDRPDQESAELPAGVMESLPVDWSSFERIDSSVQQSRVAGQEMILLDDEPRPCWLVEVQYQKGSRARAAPGVPVRYWIDQQRGYVLRQAFSQRSPQKDAIHEWIFSAASIRANGQPPRWAVDALPQLAGSERKEWVGRDAPDFALTNLDGGNAALAQWRGKVVVLSFWASWCAPCKDELAVLEKVRAEFAGDGVEIRGVNNEPPAIARAWLHKQGRSLPTVYDEGREVYRAYEIDKIPVSVVIDQRGRVASFVEGVRGEFYFRGVLERLLASQ